MCRQNCRSLWPWRHDALSHTHYSERKEMPLTFLEREVRANVFLFERESCSRVTSAARSRRAPASLRDPRALCCPAPPCFLVGCARTLARVRAPSRFAGSRPMRSACKIRRERMQALGRFHACQRPDTAAPPRAGPNLEPCAVPRCAMEKEEERRGGGG